MNSDAPQKSILLVDDDSFIIDMYSVKFTAAGYALTVAQSVEDALAKLRGGLTPDILITDLVMPKMTGFDLLETVKKEQLIPKATKIVLSNQSESADIARAKELGAQGHIIKANAIPSEVLSLVEQFAAKNT